MRRTERSASRGTTIVEAMMGLAMLAIGASGIIAMQKVTVVANRDARNIEVANEIARTWLERLRADAMVWNHPSSANYVSDIGETLWLGPNVKTPGSEAWFRPVNTNLGLYGVHDALGRDNSTGSLAGPYCVNMRLTWHRPNRSIRAEVRVYWQRQNLAGTGKTLANPLCGQTPGSPPNIQYDTDMYHFVHATTLINQNIAY